MQTTSQKASIREMDAEELQEFANELYSKCGGEVLMLSDKQFEDLKEAANNYYHLTGETLQPKITRQRIF